MAAIFEAKTESAEPRLVSGSGNRPKPSCCGVLAGAKDRAGGEIEAQCVQIAKRTTIMRTGFAMCAVLVSMLSTVALGQQVSVNYNHSQSFAQFHTYAWGSNDANQIKNSILAQVAHQHINQAMQSKGLMMVEEAQNPDVILVADGGMKEQTSYTAWGMRGFGGGMTTITPEQNVVGTLIVNLYDAKNQTLMWRGVAQSTLSDNGGKNQKTVINAIQKMFKQWPK